MIRASVIGEVWATRKCRGLDGASLKVCAEIGPDGMLDHVVVVRDTLGARRGQEVVVSFGSGARNVLAPGAGNRALLCDAAISMIVEGTGRES